MGIKKYFVTTKCLVLSTKRFVAAAKFLVAAAKNLFVVPNFVAVTKPFFSVMSLTSWWNQRFAEEYKRHHIWRQLNGGTSQSQRMKPNITEKMNLLLQLNVLFI